MIFHIRKIYKLGDATYPSGVSAFQLLLEIGNGIQTEVEEYSTLSNAKAGAVAQLGAGQSFTWVDNTASTESVSNTLPWL